MNDIMAETYKNNDFCYSANVETFNWLETQSN